MSQPICELFEIRQQYCGRDVLDIPYLSLEQGSITGLSGPNGCGKSTLLRIMAQLESPAIGTVLLNGERTDAASTPGHRDVTLLLQEPFLLKQSVYSNVAFGLRARGMEDEKERVYEALRLVGLAPVAFCHRKWYELSGGEAQRVALAARLAFRPALLLLDEPTASLDEASAATIREAALSARSRFGTTLVIVSHDMKWLHAVSDTVICMERGSIVKQKTTQGENA
jgi:tungstate transport system ATP-binding protein